MPKTTPVINTASRHACVDSTLEFLENLVNESPKHAFSKDAVLCLIGFARNDEDLMTLWDSLDRSEDNRYAWAHILGAVGGIAFGAFFTAVFFLVK